MSVDYSCCAICYRGYIFDGRETYHVDPVSGTLHRLFRNRDRKKLPFKCGKLQTCLILCLTPVQGLFSSLLSGEDSGSCSKYSVCHVFCLILCQTLVQCLISALLSAVDSGTCSKYSVCQTPVQCLISALLSAEDSGSCSKYIVCHVFCLMVPPAQEWSHSIFVKTKY